MVNRANGTRANGHRANGNRARCRSAIICGGGCTISTLYIYQMIYVYILHFTFYNKLSKPSNNYIIFSLKRPYLV